MENAPSSSTAAPATCFVVMGFGKKTDFETGRVLDLDKSYRNLIKPAVIAAGLQCVRADEIVHSGLIDVPMYEQLLSADVVIADLSTSNKNAFYELGIRHALRPFTTVIIAEDGIKTFPFDIAHVAVRQYHHMGDGIDFDEVERFRGLLTDTVKTILQKTPEERRDSPVYAFLQNLVPPELQKVLQKKLDEALDAHSEATAATGSAAISALETHSLLMDKVDDAEKKGDWTTAKALLALVRQLARAADEERRRKEGSEAVTIVEDPSLLQRLALTTYKSRQPDAKTALDEAKALLERLDPKVSNDMVTLGLWGSVHKNLWEETQQPQDLDESILAYKRGFYNRGDSYNGINLAFMLNVRAAEAARAAARAEAITDFVTAQRVRSEVLEICDEWLTGHQLSEAARADAEQLENYRIAEYWAKATKAEALLGLNRDAEAAPLLAEAYASAPAPWMQATTAEQLGKLRALLASSPLAGL